jgi:hypothetical protein
MLGFKVGKSVDMSNQKLLQNSNEGYQKGAELDA